MNVPDNNEMLTETASSTNPSTQKPPWSPAMVATVTILFSVLAGGIFHAINYERLGFPHKKKSTLTTNILLFIFILLLSYKPMPSLLLGVFQLVFHIGCATSFYKSQNYLYKRHLSVHGTKASNISILGISFLIFLALLGVNLILFYFFDI